MPSALPPRSPSMPWPSSLSRREERPIITSARQPKRPFSRSRGGPEPKDRRRARPPRSHRWMRRRQRPIPHLPSTRLRRRTARRRRIGRSSRPRSRPRRPLFAPRCRRSRRRTRTTPRSRAATRRRPDADRPTDVRRRPRKERVSSAEIVARRPMAKRRRRPPRRGMGAPGLRGRASVVGPQRISGPIWHAFARASRPGNPRLPVNRGGSAFASTSPATAASRASPSSPATEVRWRTRPFASSGERHPLRRSRRHWGETPSR